MDRGNVIQPLLIVSFLSLSIFKVEAEELGMAEKLDKFGRILDVSGASATDLGKTMVGTTLSRAGNVASVGKTITHAKKGDLPATIGAIVETGVGIVTIPAGAGGGTMAMPGPGTVAGAYAGSKIAEHTGNQAKKLTEDTIKALNKYNGNSRSNLQKLIDETGIDSREIADKYDFSVAGQHKKYMTELLNEIENAQWKDATTNVRPYFEDPRLATLRKENGLTDAEDIGRPFGPSISEFNREEEPYGNEVEEQSQDKSELNLNDQETDENDNQILVEENDEDLAGKENGDKQQQDSQSQDRTCPPELLKELETGMQKRFYQDADPNNNNIENREEVENYLDVCLQDSHYYTTASDRAWLIKNCSNAYTIYKNGIIALEQRHLEDLKSELEDRYQCKFAISPQISEWPSSDPKTAQDGPVSIVPSYKAPVAPKTSPTKDIVPGITKKWSFKPPKIWVDQN